MSDWLSELEAWEEREKDEENMARMIRELVAYIAFLEGYCSKTMLPEKARGRFQLPKDARELLR